jgi:hypothetical protein
MEGEMNKSKLIWGIVLLVLAGGLAIGNLVLPPGTLTFQVEDRNMPWVPPAVAAVIGIFLLATSFQGGEAGKTGEPPIEQPVDPDRAALNKRLEGMAWGAFLIMLGCRFFIPEEQVNEGWWSVGLGIILLGLNATRYFNGLRMSGFTVVFGVIALVTGIGELAGLDLPGLAILLILLGANLLLRPWFERQRLFGKAEES